MQKIPIRQLKTVPHELPSSERFTIRRVEDIVLPNDERKIIQHLHKHDFFFILALQKGKGIHEIDFVAYTVHDHAVYFLRPGQAHRLDLQAGCTGFLLEFNSAFYHPSDPTSSHRLRKASQKNYCKPQSNRFEKLQAVLSSIYNEYTEEEEGYQDIIKANLDIFLIEFIRQSQDPKSTNTNPHPYAQERLEEFLELLEKHIAVHKQVSDYTNLMNLSPYQLNEITKSSIGKTASGLINEHIVLEAKRYLVATPNQVKDIADLLGYEDVSYFIRFFKKQTGYSPAAFRQNSR